jgi:hypothetical protein
MRSAGCSPARRRACGGCATAAVGCRLFLWSTGGGDYCREVATAYGLADLFEAFLPKPDLIIDDAPGMCLSPIVCNVHEEESWPAMAERIVGQYVM